MDAFIRKLTTQQKQQDLTARETAFQQARAKAAAADAAKTARLRALRLAKEAEEAQAKASAPPQDEIAAESPKPRATASRKKRINIAP